MHKVTVVAAGLAHPEGPDLLPDGRLVFVETFAGRISVLDPTGVRSYAVVGGAPNACTVGFDGLYVTQNGGRLGDWRAPNPTVPSIQRVTTGVVEIVADRVDGDPLTAPNDLTFGPDRRLYFTDPGQWDPEHPSDGRLCVIDQDGTTRVLVETGATYPNGIVAEPDGSIVWDESYTRTVRRRHPDGSISLLAQLPKGHIPDGIKRAANGNLYVTTITSGGVDVLAPSGGGIGFVSTGGEPQNCLFVERDLWITDFGEISQFSHDGLRAAAECGRLLRVPLGTSGSPLFRGAIAVGRSTA